MNPLPPEYWKNVEDLFYGLIDLDPAAQSHQLDQIENPALRQEVAALLAALERSDEVLRDLDKLVETAAGKTVTLPSRTGTRVAQYAVGERLGSGSMGVVYSAHDTLLDRPVALKFLTPHPGGDTRTHLLAEARAASALDHPNIAVVYEVGETADGQRFLALVRYSGETLKAKIARGPLPLATALDYAVQITRGLAQAHAHGIVHRDVKPANVIVTDEGVAKIVDFGIAQQQGTAQDASTATWGTLAYMSPEQMSGAPVDARADLWAVGVVLYEMLTGARPFQGTRNQAVIYAVLHEAPHPIDTLRPGLPKALLRLLNQALEKDPAHRFQTTAALLTALETAHAEATGHTLRTVGRLLKKPRVALAALAVVLLLAALVILPFTPQLQRDRARALLPDIERLAEAGNYAEAYALATRAEQALSSDSALAQWWPLVADYLSVTTVPEGAGVYVQRFVPHPAGPPPEPVYLGTTPLHNMRLARGDYRVRFEKEGYAPLERMVSRGFTPRVAVEAQLVAADQAPEDMVFVPGGAYRLVSWATPTDAVVELADFFIDRHEVSNANYQAFIEAGGYQNPAYWPAVTPAEAVQTFTDQTGLPGPRHWANQSYPEGRDTDPVTGITWYEAAAYAAFRGKRLPTLYEWEKAARDGAVHPYGIVMPWGLQRPGDALQARANFSSTGPEAVDAYPFGVSPFGAYNMGGNVKEWCANPRGDGYTTTGGSWEDPMYLFPAYGTFPGTHTASTLGFRCARSAAPETGDQGAGPLPREAEAPPAATVDAATFRRYLTHYQYDKDLLDAHITDRLETPAWTRETITLTGIGSEALLAYLYLPRSATPPYQTLLFVDADPVFMGLRSPTVDIEQDFAGHIQAGRALLTVVPKGGLERPHGPDFQQPAPHTVRYRALVTHWAAEISRGLDYLETRADIDMDRLAYFATSGGGFKIIFAAVEPRYRAVVLQGSGLRRTDALRLPEVNPGHFVPYIRKPTLILNGRHDEIEPYQTNLRPLFARLPGPKRFELVDGGHVPAPEQRVPVINAWLDEILGPVQTDK